MPIQLPLSLHCAVRLTWRGGVDMHKKHHRDQQSWVKEDGSCRDHQAALRAQVEKAEPVPSPWERSPAHSPSHPASTVPSLQSGNHSGKHPLFCAGANLGTSIHALPRARPALLFQKIRMYPISYNSNSPLWGAFLGI